MLEPTHATGWSLTESDEHRIAQELDRLLSASGARSVLLVDRNGDLVTSVGEPLVDDLAAFAASIAADFTASSQMARTLGAAEFTSLSHEGATLSVFLADVAAQAIVAVIFDHQTTYGMVRLRARQCVSGLVDIFVEMVTRVRVGSRAGSPRPNAMAGADDEIGQLVSG